MQQRGPWMMQGHPVSICATDLVVYPGKRTSRRPVHNGSGLPAESEPLVFVLVCFCRLRPSHYRQFRQPDPWRYLGVRVFQPSRGPHQGAWQRGKAEPVSWRSHARCGTVTVCQGPLGGSPPSGSSGPSTSRKSSGRAHHRSQSHDRCSADLPYGGRRTLLGSVCSNGL